MDMTPPDPSSAAEPGEPADPHLVHELASAHPDGATAAAAGVTRVAHGAGLGRVPLGPPRP
ncbi:hypothetical protein GBZ26_27340, partial [Azospirillum formosense]